MSTFAEDIDTAITGATKNDEGKTVYPEGTNDNVVYAAGLEQRRRDTQSALSKEKDSTTRLTAENKSLAETWQQEVAKTLTSEQQTELEELKHQDPEEWRTKLNEYEQTNATNFETKRKTIADNAGKVSEEERRVELLNQHNVDNPDHALTDDVIANDLPPRFLKKLEKGGSFEEFLNEANTYLGKGKVLGGNGDNPSKDPDLSNSGGSHTPSEESVGKNISDSYKGEIY